MARPSIAIALPRDERGPVADALRVLVAEDDPVNQMMIRHLLMRLGVRPQLVADGREAVAE